ncbi:MAG: hypothetical protein WDO24_16475 [Pseudomonadota bacterium]
MGMAIMDGDRTTPALEEMLRDPITHIMMASDKVGMADLVALLAEARRRLDAPQRRSRED